MSIIKLTGIGDIQEQRMAPPALYDLVCTKITEKVKDGKLGFQCIYEIEGEDDQNFAPVFDHMSIPSEGDDKDKVQFKLLMIKRRLTILGMEDALVDEAFDPMDLMGARTVQAIPITISPEDVEAGYKEGRNIDWPRLPTEEDEDE